MAGEMERDAKLILRAEDRASRTFGQVADSIKNVRKEIAEQSKAARDGAGDLGVYQRGLADLQAAGDDLVKGQSLIRQFQSQSEAIGRAEDRLKSVTAALDAYRQKAGDNPTDNQSAQIEKRVNSVAKAQAALDKATARVREIETRMERAGIATNNLETQFDQMGAAAVEAAAGIAAAKNAIDDYPAAVKRAADAANDLKLAQQFDARDTSFLAPDQFAFIQSLDGAKAKLAELDTAQAQFQRREQAVAATERQIADQRKADLAAVLRGNDALEAEFKELAAAEQRLSDLRAFRQIGTDAAEAAVKTERYGASVQRLGNDFQSLAEQVRGSLGGSSASLQSLAQSLTQVDASTELLEKGSKRLNDFQQSAGRLAIAQATLVRAAENVDAFRRQELAVRSAEAAFNEAQAEVLRLARAVGEADEPVEKLATELEQAQRALNRAGAEMQRERNEAVKLSDALRKAGIDTDNLEEEQRRLAAGAAKAGSAAEGLRNKLGGRGGFLGLNGYELQNLGFQVNDIFTSLASGISPTQTLAQQGGQIVQLFPGLVAGFISLLPVILPVAAAIGLVAYNMIQMKREADAIKGFDKLFALSGDAVGLSARQFGLAQVALQKLGIDAKDAKAALVTFAQADLNPQGLDTFLSTVKAINDATGIGFPEAATKYSEALTGGYEGVASLNDITGTLTDAQLDEIQALFDAGKAQEARTEVAEIYRVKAQEIANKQKTEWKTAVDDLGKSFTAFNTSLNLSEGASSVAKAAVDQIIGIMNKLTGAIQTATTAYNYLLNIKARGEASIKTAGGLTGDFDAELERRRKLLGLDKNGNPIPPKAATPARGNPVPTGGDQGRSRQGRALLQQQERELRNAKLLTREERLRTAEVEARRKAAEAGLGNDDVALAAANARKIEQNKLNKEDAAAAKKRETAANKAARAAETLANQRRTLEEGLIRELASLEAKADKDQNQSLADRIGTVDKAYTGLFQKIEAFRRKGGTTIDGQSIGQYEAAAREQMQLLKNTETQKFYEDQVNDAIKARAEKLKDIQDQLDRGAITPENAITQFGETISRFGPEISKMASDALAFAQNLRTAVPNPRLEAYIAKMQGVLAKQTGGADRTLSKTLASETIGDEGKKLDQLIQQRDALVQAQEALVKLGVQTRQQAQARIEEAYGRTNPLIAAQSDQLKALLDQFVTAYPEMQIFYDTWIAKLQGVAAASEPVNARFTQLKNGIDQIITSGAVDAIDSIAMSFANLARGQQSAVDTLLQIGAAFLNFVAQTIIGIAKLILQMLILSAVERTTGIPVGALLKFMDVASSGLHTGGVVGQEKTFSRQVPSIAFANAPRYHGGGVAGFAPDEVPAVLKRNEEVLTETDPRHRFNLGGGGDAPAADAPPQRNILVLDPRELADALAGPEGEKVTMSHIRRNKTTLQQVVKD